MPSNWMDGWQKGPTAVRTIAAALCLALAGAEHVACAQGSPRVVDLDDAVVVGQETERAAGAHALFADGRWEEAAVALEAVASAQTGDARPVVDVAEFELAVSLYQLGYLQASYARFSLVSSRPDHARFREALPWLALLATRLPEPANVIERIGHYDEKLLAAFDTDAQRPLFWQLDYLLGRYEYTARDYERAIALLGRVAPESEYYVKAKFFEGISHVQRREPEPALASFRAVLAAIDDGAGGADRERMRDLANLSLARTNYSTSIRFDETGSLRVDPRKLGAAIDDWNRISSSSEYWLDALFEQAWAYFLAGDYPHALGNVFTIESPYFPQAIYPEADVIKSVSYLTNCRYAEAATVATELGAEYEPLSLELREVLDRYRSDDGDARLFELVRAVRAGTADLPPDIRPIVTQALGDRELLRTVEYVDVLDAEARRLEARGPAFKASPLGAEIADAVDIARATAIDKAGSLARSRYERYEDELAEHLASAKRILSDVSTAERHERDAVVATHSKFVVLPDEPVEIDSDDEHEVWPFDGEYWRDELGTYRQVMVSRCER
jgi:tetratricopeptide (TPR) repeat protein